MHLWLVQISLCKAEQISVMGSLDGSRSIGSAMLVLERLLSMNLTVFAVFLTWVALAGTVLVLDDSLTLRSPCSVEAVVFWTVREML